MADEWIDVSVADIAAKSPNALATGPFGSAISSRFFQSSGVPVIRGSNLTDTIDQRLVEEDFAFVSLEKAEEFRRSIARKGDLVFTCWGTIGQVGLIDERARYDEYVISNKQMKLTPDPRKADSLFLYYVFSSPPVREGIKNQAIGSSVPGFNLRQLKSFRLCLPPVSAQRAAAGVLSALDDKIEQNGRTAQALELLARAIFRSWFVDFEPVKAKSEGATSFPSMPQSVFDALPTRCVGSKIGPVPDGWEVGTLGSILKESTNRNGDKQLELVLSAVSSGELIPSDDHFTKRVYSKSTKNYKVVPPGAVAFNPSRINIGSVGVNHRDVSGVVSPAYIVCVAEREFEWFLEFYLHLEKVRKQYETLASGSVRQSLRPVDFLSIELPIPPIGMVSAFDDRFLTLNRLSIALMSESSKLAGLRDYLLPRLLNGSVRVEAANG